MQPCSQPSLPLSRDAFRHALHVGLGRARLHVDGFGAAGFRDEILGAATVCRTYDPQVEGLPAAWLADFCEDAGVVEEVVSRQPEGGHWDRALRCGLLHEFALRGYAGARDRLYASCEPTEFGDDLHGLHEIIELDGEAGLLFIARKLGGRCEAGHPPEVPDSALWTFDSGHGEGKALQVLEAEAGRDLAIRSYLKALHDVERAGPVPRPARASTAETLAAIAGSAGVLYGLIHWGRHAAVEDLERVLQVALTDTRPLVIENALRCLSGSEAFPLHPELLALLRHPERGVRRYGAVTLGHHCNPRLRAAGLAALEQDLEVALALLRRNAVAEDVGAILGVLRPIPDAGEQHGVVFDLMDLVRDNAAAWDPAIALYVYEHSPCMNCRAKAVQALLTAKACPEWLLDEGRLDASEEVRELCTEPDAASPGATAADGSPS